MMGIRSGRTVLRQVRSLLEPRDPRHYLNTFPKRERPTRFEQLAAEAVANVLHLPLFDNTCDDQAIPNRVTWFGKCKPLTKAGGGMPDAIARACGFTALLEATLQRGSDQCAREYAAAIRHAKSYAKENRLDIHELYIVLLTRRIAEDTYNAVKSRSSDMRMILLEPQVLVLLLETSVLAFTLRHVDVQNFLGMVQECLLSSQSLSKYREDVETLGANWQKGILRLEQYTIVALKSYREMLKANQKQVGVSEILKRLRKQPELLWYYGRLDGNIASINARLIQESLDREGMGFRVKLPTGECVYCPVTLSDFKSRNARRLRAIEACYS